VPGEKLKRIFSENLYKDFIVFLKSFINYFFSPEHRPIEIN